MLSNGRKQGEQNLPDIKLGIEGEEVILPKGCKVEIPVSLSKSIKETEMSDGSFNYAFGKQRRLCTLSWNPLSLYDKQVLFNLSKINSILHFQNNYEDDTWYDVIITDFFYSAIDVNGTEMYLVSLNIKGSI